MKQFSYMVLVLLTISWSFADDNYGFTVGHLRTGDELIETVMEKGTGSSEYQSTYFRTYTGKNHEVISRVVCEDKSEEQTEAQPARAALVAGGPGHTFVTVVYTIPQNDVGVDEETSDKVDRLKFEVKIYGHPLKSHHFL